MQLSAALVATAHEAARAVQAARAAQNGTAIHQRPARGWRGRRERAQSMRSVAKGEWSGISNRRPRAVEDRSKCRLHGMRRVGRTRDWCAVGIVWLWSVRSSTSGTPASSCNATSLSVHMQAQVMPPQHRHTFGSVQPCGSAQQLWRRVHADSKGNDRQRHATPCAPCRHAPGVPHSWADPPPCPSTASSGRVGTRAPRRARL